MLFHGEYEDHGEPIETCQLCEHGELRYHFEIRNASSTPSGSDRNAFCSLDCRCSKMASGLTPVGLAKSLIA